MNIFNISIFFAANFLVVTIYTIKRRKIDFGYSLFWLFVSGAIFILSLDRDLLENIAGFLSVHYAPSVLFIAGILFSIALNFYLTVKATEMKRKITRLAQEVGILKESLSGGREK